MKIELTNAMLHVAIERRRQEMLKAAGRFDHTPADPISDLDKLPMLMEELGEVAKAIMEGQGTVSDSVDLIDGAIVRGKGKKGKELRKELIQLAALAVAWIESFGDHPIVEPTIDRPSLSGIAEPSPDWEAMGSEAHAILSWEPEAVTIDELVDLIARARKALEPRSPFAGLGVIKGVAPGELVEIDDNGGVK